MNIVNESKFLPTCLHSPRTINSRAVISSMASIKWGLSASFDCDRLDIKKSIDDWSIVSLSNRARIADVKFVVVSDAKRPGKLSREKEFLGQCSTVTFSLFVYVHLAYDMALSNPPSASNEDRRNIGST